MLGSIAGKGCTAGIIEHGFQLWNKRNTVNSGGFALVGSGGVVMPQTLFFQSQREDQSSCDDQE